MTRDEKTAYIKSGYSIRTGAVRNRDLAHVLASDDDLDRNLPHTARLTRNQGDWGFGLLKWTAGSTCVARIPKDQMIAVGEHGNVAVLGSGENYEERIITKTDSPEKRGPIREVREIGGKAYAVGMDRQVYRRDGRSSWVCVDGNMRKAPALDVVFGFESIHGFSEQDMYAVGWHGEMWRYDGKAWKEIASPTNLLLTRVFCAPGGTVYACGQRGMLLRGSKSIWEVVEHRSTQEDLWDLQWFEGKLYLSTTSLVYTLEKDALVPVAMDDEVPEACYHLDAADGIMWSIGPKDVIQFDGKSWTRIV